MFCPGFYTSKLTKDQRSKQEKARREAVVRHQQKLTLIKQVIEFEAKIKRNKNRWPNIFSPIIKTPEQKLKKLNTKLEKLGVEEKSVEYARLYNQTIYNQQYGANKNEIAANLQESFAFLGCLIPAIVSNIFAFSLV